MPLVDEDVIHTDRRPRSAWPWVLVVAALALLWIGLSVVFSPIARAPAAGGPSAPVQQNALVLKQAEDQVRWGGYAQAAYLIQSVDTRAAMPVMDKHTYFRLGGESLVRTGSPLAGARFHERYLGWAADVKGPDCVECHAAPTSISPTRPSDALGSALAGKWTAALKKAGKLRPRRDELAAQLKKKPGDLRTLLLLASLERALGDKEAAEEHSRALRAAE